MENSQTWISGNWELTEENTCHSLPDITPLGGTIYYREYVVGEEHIKYVQVCLFPPYEK